ncbi:MAG: sulfotransferase [Actinomycetota bacterium]
MTGVVNGSGRGSRSATEVFVTVGTDHHPFDRIVDWVDSWLAHGSRGVACFIQYGTSKAPSFADGDRLVPHGEMSQRLATADVVVCHGGPGTILNSLRAGTKPIVLPRRADLGEHVDDHQRRFARRLQAAGLIEVAETPDDLARLLGRAIAGEPEFQAATRDDEIARTVQRFAALTEPLTGTGVPLRILYVGGWGRSGSTLLDRLLGQLPGAFSLGEMRDIWLRGVLQDRRCGCGEPFLECAFWSAVGERAFGGWSRAHAMEMHRLRMRFDRPWTIPVLALRTHWLADLERYVEATGEIYRAIIATSGASVVVDSTKIPSYAFLLERIPDVDLRFVHLVRDSRGVIHSWQRSVIRPDATGRPDRMIRYGTASASMRYLIYNLTADAVGVTGTPYLRARYEDLAAHPAQVLRQIAEFGGLSTDGVDPLEGEGANLGVSHTVDGNPMRFERGHLTIRLDEAWRRDMHERDRRIVTVATAPLLRRYGYLGHQV